jgi:two-component system, NarL family, sensor kinase
MSRRTAAWLAWSLCALSLTLTTLSLLLLAMNASHPDVTIYYFWLETTLVAAGYSTVGAIVASRLPSIPVGWLFCAIGLGFGATHFSAEYATYALLAVPGSLPGGEALAWIQSWLWVPTLGLVVFLVLLFPDGRLPSDRWRWFARFTVAVVLAGAILQAFSSQTTRSFGALQTSLVQNPLGIEGLPDIGLEVQALMYGLIVVGTASMLLRLRHAGSIQRQQIKWFAYAKSLRRIYFLLSPLRAPPCPTGRNTKTG